LPGAALTFPESGPDAVVRNLKRPALLFEQIYVLHLEGMLALLDKLRSESDLQFIADLEWVLGQGILRSTSPVELTNPFQEAANAHPRIIERAFEYSSAMSEGQIASVRPEWLAEPGAVLLYSRTPLYLRSPQEIHPSKPKADVLSIAFGAFPEPEQDTPWEQILEFRRDPDSVSQALALRRWISRISHESIPEKEISQEIEWLLHEYESHMRLHRMKLTMGTLETIVVSFGEFVENLVKLKFGAIAKGLFSLEHRRIALLEAESQAPGREVAYIAQARKIFGTTRD